MQEKATETPAKDPKEPVVPEVQDGELTIDMIRQAFSLRYMEFANEETVNWRVDKENRRLIPTISAAKNNADSHTGLFWDWSDYLIAENKPFSFVASSDGRIYEIRENNHLRIATPSTARRAEAVPVGVSLKLPKIPGTLLQQTLQFFAHFATENREAHLYITWNKVDRTYQLHCPEQWSNYDTVKSDYTFAENEELYVAMHSHHHM